MQQDANTRLGQYESVMPLHASKDVMLIRHTASQRLYVKKSVHRRSRGVYESLLEKTHPNLANIVDVIDDGQEHITVIEEYIQGQPLSALVEQAKAMQPVWAMQAALQLCDALTFLHTQQPPIIHRDIKPSNIMCASDGSIKLIDFDASRIFRQDAPRDTVILGTAGYAAPEQFGFAQTDARSDIYALGVVLSTMLTGEHPQQTPYQGDADIAAILSRCMHIDPQSRYADAAALREDLRRVQAKLQTDASHQQAQPADTPKQTRRYYAAAPPGFRSGTPWKMAVALAGYAAIVWISLQITSSDPRQSITTFVKFDFALMLLTLVAVYTNYLQVQNLLPLFASNSMPKRMAAYGISTLFVLFLFVVLLAIANVILS
ncbi:serine/threonine protein kinase [Eubacteriales bacterium OttesenSCG-928-N14]|nr:serine/threonine protein kinase [Eubacteriales bacterium OttesenSCG-928-N14]